MEDVVITSALRTPMGGFQGDLDSFSASELGGKAIEGAMEQAGVDRVDEVLMGNVLGAGQGQAPARQASFAAGLDETTPATTLNKMCGSGMKAAMIGFDQIKLGENKILAVGGMESMSNAPYLLPKMRSGARLGHGKAVDHMFLDGLEDAYEPGRLMGTFAEDCAEKYQFTREAQDNYALTSLENSLSAQKSGAFENEIKAIEVIDRKGIKRFIGLDEQPQNAQPDKIPNLKPAFRTNGTVTAANSSSISDGGAALILASKIHAENEGLPKRARIMGHSSYAHAPELFTTAPIYAVKKLLKSINWSIEMVDLWEVNEAFAVVPMAFMQELDVSRKKMNVHGGACAIGHPIGASGARIMVTLLNALERYDLKRGVAAVCIGGGEGTAIAIERA
ncbi:acetyl-CoA C-acyltransferase [Paracoccaceae bacterium]|nr:acetyl-CoA C-acyltransferase [Paracoccaceae bacterium]